MSKSLFLTVFALFIASLGLAAQTNDAYANYLINSTPSLQYSWQMGQSGNAMVAEIERLGRQGQQSGKNNADANARGMAFINNLQGVYLERDKASLERRKRQLQQQYRDNYNAAKYYRDYYLRYGDPGRASYYQNIMNIYSPN